jgi:hypothetical protein
MLCKVVAICEFRDRCQCQSWSGRAASTAFYNLLSQMSLVSRPPAPALCLFGIFPPHQHIDVSYMFDCCMMPHFCVMPHFASQLFFFCCVLCVVWKGLRVDRLGRQLKNRVPTCVVSLSRIFSLHFFSASHIPSCNLDSFAHCVFQSRIPNRSVHFK